MKFSAFVVIILWILLNGKSSLGSVDQEIHKEVTIAEQCEGYCFSSVKPFFDHLDKLKVEIDANNEMKDKIHSLQLTINDLQGQLLKSETETKNSVEQIKDKDKQIKDRDEQIKDLREQVKMVSGVLAERNDQLSQTNQTAENLPDTCPNGSPNGIYKLKVKGIEEPFQVPCVSPSSGWTVIQRRIDGSVDFNRNWTDYKDGFGDVLGLEKVHLMTLGQPYELYIQLRDVNGTTGYARYDDFKVGSEKEAYKLKSLGEYSGTAGDSLTDHVNMKFTTLDRDETSEKYNCAEVNGGGWWFENCGYSFLNGNYYDDDKKPVDRDNGIHWGSFHNYEYTTSLTFAQMMIRPKPFLMIF